MDTEPISGVPQPRGETDGGSDGDTGGRALATGPDTESIPAVGYADDQPSAWRELLVTIHQLATRAARREQSGRGRPGVAGFSADPRLPIWIGRAAICLLAGTVFGFLLGWRAGLTIAVVIAIGDALLRSRTTMVIPAAIRVTRAQRQTTRRLAVVRPAGYLALRARTIPGTESVIDNLVVGPPGVYAVDSELWDRRLQIKIAARMLYHGPAVQQERLDHCKWEAKQAANLLSAELGRPVLVRPVMVIYGPSVPWTYMRIANVDVFGGGRIAQYFRHQSKISAGRHLNGVEVARLYAAAERALPPIASARAESGTATPTR